MSYLAPTRARVPPERPVLVYDDDCGFCYAAAQAIQRRARQPVDLLPFSGLPQSGLLSGLDCSDLYASAHLVTPDGREYHGAESITRALRLVPGGWLAGFLDLPGLSLARDLGYRAVEMNRHRISRLMGMDACDAAASGGRAQRQR